MREGRLAAGMTQEKLGLALKRYLGEPWAKQTVSAAEQGRRAFAVEDLFGIARALNVAVISLLLPAGDMRVKVGKTMLSADDLRDAVMGQGAAAQLEKVAARAHAAAEENLRLLREFASEAGIPWKEG
jgi:transcriptional regulator with XRE-family HTH domain